VARLISMADSKPESAPPLRAPGAGSRPLSSREREVLGYLAEGLSGAAIAERLVLSPETVRTHVRNAMEKLGASTRSQAVALALETGVIGDVPVEKPVRSRGGSSQGAAPVGLEKGPILTALLAGVVSLADIESGAIYSAEDGGMLLRLAAQATGGTGPGASPPAEVTLGDPGIGRVALERRARLIGSTKAGAHPLLASPMTSGSRLTGVLALGIRPSRPASRRELLLIEAFANRIADIIASGSDPAALRMALQRFKASWTETLEA
jgi:DNA-binding CsgD family transcriptional regulator